MGYNGRKQQCYMAGRHANSCDRSSICSIASAASSPGRHLGAAGCPLGALLPAPPSAPPPRLRQLCVSETQAIVPRSCSALLWRQTIQPGLLLGRGPPCGALQQAWHTVCEGKGERAAIAVAAGILAKRGASGGVMALSDRHAAANLHRSAPRAPAAPRRSQTSHHRAGMAGRSQFPSCGPWRVAVPQFKDVFRNDNPCPAETRPVTSNVLPENFHMKHTQSACCCTTQALLFSTHGDSGWRPGWPGASFGTITALQAQSGSRRQGGMSGRWISAAIHRQQQRR